MLRKAILSIFCIFAFLITNETAQAEVPNWIQMLGQHGALQEVAPENQSEITCLALAIYYEARGESERGQRAVAQVVINRSRSTRFPSTICGVLLQRSQFSFMRGTPMIPRTETSWVRALNLAKDMVATTPEPSRWLFFCNCGRRGFRIGRHIFY